MGVRDAWLTLGLRLRRTLSGALQDPRRPDHPLNATHLAALRLAAIVESSDDAILGQDLDGIITSWNKGAEKMFGFAADEMVGRSVALLIPANRQNEEVELLSRIKHGEHVSPFETIRQTRSGQLIELSITASPIRNASGAVVGVSKLARDITDDKQVRAALEETERELRALTAQLQEERARLLAAQSVAKVGSWHTDLVTLVVTWSAETYRIFETSAADFVTHRPSLAARRGSDQVCRRAVAGLVRRRGASG